MMLTKGSDQTNSVLGSAGRGGSKVQQMWFKVTRGSQESPYSRMRDGTLDAKDGRRGSVWEKGNRAKEVGDKGKDKENRGPAVNNSSGKEKKKRKGWKRFRHAALVTCRYIGMGVSGMGAAYPTADYQVDPKTWNKTFGHAGSRARAQTPHWSTNLMIFSGW